MSVTYHHKELVSIVLCTFNGSQYIHEQLQSIIQQTYNHLEIIIVDDASTDDTLEIIKDFESQDHRIKVYRNATNLGYNKNFENACQLSKANYIAISDQDDIWELNKIETMVNALQEDTLFLFSLSGTFYNNDFINKKIAPKVRYTHIDNIIKLVFNSPVHGHACMFHKRLLTIALPFPHDIYYDWWLSMCAASIGTIHCLPLTLTWHRLHNTNASRDIVNILSEKERNTQLRRQMIYNVETFLKKGIAPQKEKKMLEQYISILKNLDGNQYSIQMFRFIMQHKKTIFHYKRKKIVIFSQIKNAIRMAKKGVL